MTAVSRFAPGITGAKLFHVREAPSAMIDRCGASPQGKGAAPPEGGNGGGGGSPLEDPEGDDSEADDSEADDSEKWRDSGDDDSGGDDSEEEEANDKTTRSGTYADNWLLLRLRLGEDDEFENEGDEATTEQALSLPCVSRHGGQTRPCWWS